MIMNLNCLQRQACPLTSTGTFDKGLRAKKYMYHQDSATSEKKNEGLSFTIVYVLPEPVCP